MRVASSMAVLIWFDRFVVFALESQELNINFSRLVHIGTGISVVEHPFPFSNILLTVVHRNTHFLFVQNFRSVPRGPNLQ